MSDFNWQRNFETLKAVLKEKELLGYDIKYVVDEDDAMGKLLGFQFDSVRRGGYVYFWSAGIIGRQLLDYETGEDIIEDATGEMDEGELSLLIDELSRKL